MRRALLLGLLLLGSAGAAGIKLRPQGDELTKAVQAAIAALSTQDVPMTLDSTGGPTITLGGVGVSAAPFNPDEISRVVVVGAERRIEMNPQGPVPLAEAVRQTLQAELKLKDWTPAAAQQRFGGADLNGDGTIDLADLAILMANYGSASPSAGDLNQDRKVDDADLQIFSALYSTALAQAAQQAAQPAVPTPTNPATTPTDTTTPAPTTPAPTNPAPTTPTDTTTPAPTPPPPSQP